MLQMSEYILAMYIITQREIARVVLIHPYGKQLYVKLIVNAIYADKTRNSDISKYGIDNIFSWIFFVPLGKGYLKS